MYFLQIYILTFFSLQNNISLYKINMEFKALTSTCQTFSFAPSNEQNRILTPNKPCPPHVMLGTIFVRLTDCVLLLYTVIVNSLFTPAFRSSFKVSLSWSYEEQICSTLKCRYSLLYYNNYWNCTRNLYQ